MLYIHIQWFFELEKNTYGIFTNGFLTNKNESDLCKESVICLLIFIHLFMSKREKRQTHEMKKVGKILTVAEI